jgi:hypothetical protein
MNPVRLPRASACLLALCAAVAAGPARAQPDTAKAYLPIGVAIGRIEIGERIFTPIRMLPFDHPESMGHQFPNALRLYGTEFPVLLCVGNLAGVRLWPTLERYPTEPSPDWPYAAFRPPPDSALVHAAVTRRLPAAAAPLPGLRVVVFDHRRLVAFLVDTRRVSLAARGMERATALGYDLTRAQFLAALERAAQLLPADALGVVVYAAPADTDATGGR